MDIHGTKRPFHMIETESRDGTLPLQTGMHDYGNDEFIEGEVNWSLIPSAR